MDKLGSMVSPLDVVLNGSQHQHGVWNGVFYSDPTGSFDVNSLDAGVVSPGKRTIFPTPLTPLAELNEVTETQCCSC